MTAIDIGLYCMYAFVLVAILSAIVLPFINLLKSPKDLVKGGIVIAVILAIFFVGYAMASSEVTPKYATLGVDAQGVKFIGGGLILLYVSIVGSIVIIAVSELSKLFK